MIDERHLRGGARKARATFILNMLAQENEAAPSDPWEQREQRRERLLALTLLLLEVHQIGHYSRKAKAFQRAIGVSDDVLAGQRVRLCRAMTWDLMLAA